MPDSHPETLPPDGTAVVFMIVRRTDGRPTGYPMTANIRDGGIEITTYRKAAKARYLLADGRVCCVLPDESQPGRGIALYGRAEPAPVDGFLAATTAPDGRPTTIAVPDEVREMVADRLATSKRMVFRIDIERVETLGETSGAPA